MSGYIALVQLALYTAGAVMLYRVAIRLVEQRRVDAFAAGAGYWLVLVAAPPVVALVVGGVANHIYANAIFTPPSAWDVGLAIWLSVGILACYFCGFGAASLLSWRLFQAARNNADIRAAEAVAHIER